MNDSRKNKISKFGKRTFTTVRIPVASPLGRNLIFGGDSKAVMKAVRDIAKNDDGSHPIVLTSKISSQTLESSK